MPTIQPTLTIDIDGQSKNVSDFPTEIQQLVAIYDEWRQKLADADSYSKLVGVAFQVASEQLRAAVLEEVSPKQPSETAESQQPAIESTLTETHPA